MPNLIGVSIKAVEVAAAQWFRHAGDRLNQAAKKNTENNEDDD